MGGCCVCVWGGGGGVCEHLYVCACVQVCVLVYVCTFVCVCLCVYVFVNVLKGVSMAACKVARVDRLHRLAG